MQNPSSAVWQRFAQPGWDAGRYRRDSGRSCCRNCRGWGGLGPSLGTSLQENLRETSGNWKPRLFIFRIKSRFSPMLRHLETMTFLCFSPPIHVSIPALLMCVFLQLTLLDTSFAWHPIKHRTLEIWLWDLFGNFSLAVSSYLQNQQQICRFCGLSISVHDYKLNGFGCIFDDI